MDTVSILIATPREVQLEIEEYCLNNGVDFSQYFLNLYYKNKESAEQSKAAAEIEETKQPAKKTLKK